MSHSSRSEFVITDDDFQLFSRFLEDNSGILLAKHKQYLVQSRLGKIAQEQNCSSLKELIQKIKYLRNHQIFLSSQQIILVTEI